MEKRKYFKSYTYPTSNFSSISYKNLLKSLKEEVKREKIRLSHDYTCECVNIYIYV